MWHRCIRHPQCCDGSDSLPGSLAFPLEHMFVIWASRLRVTINVKVQADGSNDRGWCQRRPPQDAKRKHNQNLVATRVRRHAGGVAERLNAAVLKIYFPFPSSVAKRVQA